MTRLTARIHWAEHSYRRHPLNPRRFAYRPHLRLAGSSEMLGVEFTDAPEVLNPGDEAMVEMKCLYPGVDYSGLEAGAHFEILEGPHVVGSGEVLSTEGA